MNRDYSLMLIIHLVPDDIIEPSSLVKVPPAVVQATSPFITKVLTFTVVFH